MQKILNQLSHCKSTVFFLTLIIYNRYYSWICFIKWKDYFSYLDQSYRNKPALFFHKHSYVNALLTASLYLKRANLSAHFSIQQILKCHSEVWLILFTRRYLAALSLIKQTGTIAVIVKKLKSFSNDGEPYFTKSVQTHSENVAHAGVCLDILTCQRNTLCALLALA